MKSKIFENATTHFFITVIYLRDDGSRSTRCWGYAETFEKAEKAVLENYTDFHEEMYPFAVIEEHVMDPLALSTGYQKWYQWNSFQEEYQLCPTPAFAKNVVAWGLG